MNAKAKGAKNERRSRKLLESAGYAVTRSSASLGSWDLVGIAADGFVLCQVKSNSWPYAEEMEAMKLFRAPANARKLVHRWRDRAKSPDVKEL